MKDVTKSALLIEALHCVIKAGYGSSDMANKIRECLEISWKQFENKEANFIDEFSAYLYKRDEADATKMTNATKYCLVIEALSSLGKAGQNDSQAADDIRDIYADEFWVNMSEAEREFTRNFSAHLYARDEE